MLSEILLKAFHTSRREGLVWSCLSAEHAMAVTSASAGFRFASCFGEVSLLEGLLSSFLLLVLPATAKFHFNGTIQKKNLSLHGAHSDMNDLTRRSTQSPNYLLTLASGGRRGLNSDRIQH